ncbi:MAG: fibronectin type III domain-containing protein [Thermodesulfobacteriota bacterium]
MKTFRHALLALSALALLLAAAPPAPAAGPGAKRPYAPDSPWNLPIGPSPEYDMNSDVYMEVFAAKGQMGADPTQYTLPVYEVSESTPLRAVRVTGSFSRVDREGRMVRVEKNVEVRVPIPDNAVQAAGLDAQIVLWNPRTGEEWGFWKAGRTGDRWEAVNGYLYNTAWSGVPPMGFMSRGAGVPYLAGLIRPWEIAAGRIEHAIAFAFNTPSLLFVYPATKSDGKGMEDLPEGARIQLDPALTEADFDAWGLDPVEKVIARALQEYGMIVIDKAGHPKIYAEYDGTAGWGGRIHGKTLRKVPYRAYKVLSLTAPERPDRPRRLEAAARGGKAVLAWEPAAGATRYQVSRRAADERDPAVIAPWVEGTGYADATARPGVRYEYAVQGVNHNGASRHSQWVRLTPP